jgi:hypothetical protein
LTDDERQRVEVWTRVMGYHRPVTSFNEGKKREFEDRVPFFDPAYQDRIHPASGPLLSAVQIAPHPSARPLLTDPDVSLITGAPSPTSAASLSVLGDWRVTTDIRIPTGATFDTCGDVRSTSAGAPSPR